MKKTFDRVVPKELTPEERKARLDQRREDGQLALQQHAAAQKAFHANRERLKAERLAREAAGGDTIPSSAPSNRSKAASGGNAASRS